MKKQAYWIASSVLVMCIAGCCALWLLSDSSPSYEKIVSLNDEWKQAHQLSLSSEAKLYERLGDAILKTTNETVLAKLIATTSFDKRFSDAILGNIKTPEAIESIAMTFDPGLFPVSDERNADGSKNIYDAILERLPNDNAVERVVLARIVNPVTASDDNTDRTYKGFADKGELVDCLCRRILAMNDGTKTESLLVKVSETGALQFASPIICQQIASRTKNPKVRQATGVEQDVLELFDLVAKWNPEYLSKRSVGEILERGRVIQQAKPHIDVVKRFDPYYRSNSLEDWVAYGKELKPVLDAMEALSEKAPSADSSHWQRDDSSRRQRLVEKRNEAIKGYDNCKWLIDKVDVAMKANDIVTIMAACQTVGVSFNGSDPEDTGYRLGRKLVSLRQEAKAELDAAERELASLDRERSQQREQDNREREAYNREMAQLKTQTETIRRQHETPESRKVREERDAAKLKLREELEAEKRKEGEKARQAALSFKSQTKVIPISGSIAIELQSVPGEVWFGKYEVTQAQWEAVMGGNPSRFKGTDNPVEMVSWDDCQEFLKKLNATPTIQESGLTFRLPTDAEWESACRAGATGKYCLLADGTEITEETLDEVAWFKDNSEDKTHPVGQKEPNAFGLYDMHGNVLEWCEEEFGEVASWAKRKDFEYDRVDRGGSWHGPAWLCGSSDRGRDPPSHRLSIRGFRLCADKRQE